MIMAISVQLLIFTEEEIKWGGEDQLAEAKTTVAFSSLKSISKQKRKCRAHFWLLCCMGSL